MYTAYSYALQVFLLLTGVSVLHCDEFSITISGATNVNQPFILG